MEHDKEDKITEFNYENYIHADALENIDQDSEEFKMLIRSMNFSSHTFYEQHRRNQKDYRLMMPLLAKLHPSEHRDLIHMMHS